MQPEALAWRDPLTVAGNVAAQGEKCWTLLYSGQRPTHSGRYSYLCLHPQETIASSDFSLLAERLSADHNTFKNAWFGTLSYELLHCSEDLPQEQQHFIDGPACAFTRYGIVLQFDHDQRMIVCYRESDISLPSWLLEDISLPNTYLPAIAELTSPMSQQRYLKAVADTKAAIARGDFYQANITRKYTGSFAENPQTFSIFRRLCEASPAAYSAYIKTGDRAILSSSPERFLTIEANGRMETRPIKGTAPRLNDPLADEARRMQLYSSEKDKAENLMIVDLMRNDLARACETGSVKVDALCELTSYATLHHLTSIISGQKRKNVTTLDAVRQCFPPGSMTGAPKIRAMQWCLMQEQIQRGVYSGALGWFGGDGSCDLSVVIRTLIVEDDRFEFQVGGGIVADSDPELEWRETLTKARGILAALGIDASRLEAV